MHFEFNPRKEIYLFCRGDEYTQIVQKRFFLLMSTFVKSINLECLKIMVNFFVVFYDVFYT